MSVLDLGAAPGSWSLYAAERVGIRGQLLAVDLQELRTALPSQATFIQGDALTLPNTLANAPSTPGPSNHLSLYAPYDVVLSDMAPNTTGNRFADQAKSYELFVRALDVARALLKPGGAFVGKIFMGEDFPAARQAVRDAFASERLIRPEGTRSISYEIFIVGQDRKVAPSSAG
jgi:23S rRNA (uridine2552-2'-O)-methyltransferase